MLRWHAHSAAGFVMSSDSLLVTSARSSTAAETCGCAAASFWLSLGGSTTGGAAALATSAMLAAENFALCGASGLEMYTDQLVAPDRSCAKQFWWPSEALVTW